MQGTKVCMSVFPEHKLLVRRAIRVTERKNEKYWEMFLVPLHPDSHSSLTARKDCELAQKRLSLTSWSDSCFKGMDCVTPTAV